MNYQVWTKGDEYSGWSKKDCADLPAALGEVLLAIRAGKEPLLTVEVQFQVKILAKEEPVEVEEGKAEPDQVAGA